MRFIIISGLFLCSLSVFGQKKELIFTNYGEPIPFGNTFLWSNKIHEIYLYQDSTYDFWSRPYALSCHTWRNYKGTWNKLKDTVVFSDSYVVFESETRVNYARDCNTFFTISFKTDKNTELKNKKIKIEYFYDFDSHLEDSAREVVFNSNNMLQIPFTDIPNFSKLASIRIEYLLNNTEKRYDFLTESDAVNIRKGDIPNIIRVEFVENPKKETVYRTIKGIIQKNTLSILSTSKTETTLPEYYRELEFEDGYKLYK